MVIYGRLSASTIPLKYRSTSLGTRAKKRSTIVILWRTVVIPFWTYLLTEARRTAIKYRCCAVSARWTHDYRPLPALPHTVATPLKIIQPPIDLFSAL